MSEKEILRIFETYVDTIGLFLCSYQMHSKFFTPVIEQEVRCYLSLLNIKKSMGHDKISAKI